MNSKKSEAQKCERETILRLNKDKKSYNEIIKINRSKSIVYYIIKKLKTKGTIMNKTRSGRSRKLIEREEKIIIGEVKKILYLYIFKYDIGNV